MRGARCPIVRSLLLCMGLAGCGGAGDDLALPTAPITRLDGELHLHEFPAGAHAWAGFIAGAVPLVDVHSDQLVELDTAPTAADGACTLYLSPTCTPDCGASAWCSATDTCTPITKLAYVDGGEVDVVGSSLVPTIRMWFSSQDQTYDADPAPGPTPLFAGGELLHVDGGAGGYRLRGTLNAPRPVIVTAPDLAQPIQLPTRGALDVRWQPDAAQEMVLNVTASRSDGSFGLVRCVVPDTGAIDGGVPASLLGSLPPAPRSLRFELERDDEEILRTMEPGVGILAHAGFTTWKNWQE